jgi:hypothetical protein
MLYLYIFESERPTLSWQNQGERFNYLSAFVFWRAKLKFSSFCDYFYSRSDQQMPAQVN